MRVEAYFIGTNGRNIMARTQAVDFTDKQRGLLEVAAKIFAEKGMEKASMSQIAKAAQVSKALLYHYYPSKDALLFAIMRTHLYELGAAVAAADNISLPPKQRLRKLVGAMLENYRGADDKHKVLLNAGRALNDAQKGDILEMERQIVRQFSAVISEINPLLNNKDRPLITPVTMSLFGMLNWMYTWFKEGGPISRDDYADLATTMIVDGIMAVS